MKLSAGFDSRSLRANRSGKWRGRFCMLLCGLLICLGALLLGSGIIMALKHDTPSPAALGPVELGGIAVVVFMLGIAGWRRCRRRPQLNKLGMAPGLLK